MRIVDEFDVPRLGGGYCDAEFLVQFAPQRLLDRLAGLELAARELPVAGIDLAFGPGRQQETARAVEEDATATSTGGAAPPGSLSGCLRPRGRRLRPILRQHAALPRFDPHCAGPLFRAHAARPL